MGPFLTADLCYTFMPWWIHKNRWQASGIRRVETFESICRARVAVWIDAGKAELRTWLAE